MTDILLGTSAFTADGWVGSFYPAGMQPRDFLKGIEAETKTWDKIIINRTADMRNWVEVLRQMINTKKVLKMFAFANNHYAGHGPATVKLFTELWDKK